MEEKSKMSFIALRPNLSYSTYHSHSLADAHLVGRHDGQVGHVDQQIADGDHGNGDEDGERKVPPGVDDLLGDVVEVVPAVVGPKARVEGDGDVPHRRGGLGVVVDDVLVAP